MKDLRLPVSEIFGPTIQGEGSLIGRPTMFVRLGGCDYRCRWCDTLYAVLPAHAGDWVRTRPSEIVAKVRALHPDPIMVTLSGGNPALFDCSTLIEEFGEDYPVALETQGSVAKEWFADLYWLTLSPKPPSAVDAPTSWQSVRTCIDAVDGGSAGVTIKIVVSDAADLEYAAEMFNEVRQYTRWTQHVRHTSLVLQVCTAPEDDERSLLAKYKKLVDVTLATQKMPDVTILPQMHRLLWGPARGV